MFADQVNQVMSKLCMQEMGAEPVATVAGLFEHQYVSLHVPLTDETKASINKAWWQTTHLFSVGG